MNILITSAGQRVSLIRAFQRELKRRFPKGKVQTVDLNPLLAPACYVADGYQKITSITSNSYIDELLSICKKNQVRMVIPTIDTELKVLSENKKRFTDLGISLIVSNIDFVSNCRDKRITNQFFKERGIAIPKEIDKNNPTFPLFIKPYDGSLSKDIFVINHKSELTKHHLDNEKYMFMEYINSQEYDEYTVDAYYDKNHNLKCVVPRKRIFVRSGEVNKGVTHKNEIVSYLKDRLSYVDGAIGCVTMQFFFNSKLSRILGIEINPRFGGGYPLSYLSGANFPKWLMEEYFEGKEIAFFNDWEENLLMLRYDDEVLVHGYKS